MKCQPLYFKGTEGVVELTQCFERMETVFCINNGLIVGHDVLLGNDLIDLEMKMTDKLELPQDKQGSQLHFKNVSILEKVHRRRTISPSPLMAFLCFDDKLHFVEEPLGIMSREVKRLKRSRIPLVKVRWNYKRDPEFTWEREDQFKKKYPHLFTNTTPSSSATFVP
ncbi:hypothetical protein Tco_1458998 [Tanacetum coccineum]